MTIRSSRYAFEAASNHKQFNTRLDKNEIVHEACASPITIPSKSCIESITRSWLWSRHTATLSCPVRAPPSSEQAKPWTRFYTQKTPSRDRNPRARAPLKNSVGGRDGSRQMSVGAGPQERPEGFDVNNAGNPCSCSAWSIRVGSRARLRQASVSTFLVFLEAWTDTIGHARTLRPAIIAVHHMHAWYPSTNTMLFACRPYQRKGLGLLINNALHPIVLGSFSS